jgi:hypothetical protein
MRRCCFTARAESHESSRVSKLTKDFHIITFYFFPLALKILLANAANSCCEHVVAKNGCIRSCSQLARLVGSMCKQHFRKCLNLWLHLSECCSVGDPFVVIRRSARRGGS